MARWVAVTVAVKRIWVASNPLGIGARIEIKLGVPGMGFEPIRTFVLRFLRPLRLPLRHPGAESAMLVAG